MEQYCKTLFFIQNYINLEKLEQVYGEDMALHLWNKFIFFDRNLLDFINYLDKDNKKIFFDSLKNNVFFDENFN